MTAAVMAAVADTNANFHCKDPFADWPACRSPFDGQRLARLARQMTVSAL